MSRFLPAISYGWWSGVKSEFIVNVTSVRVVEGIDACVVAEDEYAGTVVVEDEVIAVVMEDDAPVGAIANDEEPMTGIMMIEDEITGVIEDC